MRLNCDREVLQISFQLGKVVDFWALSHFSGTIEPENQILCSRNIMFAEHNNI